MKTIGAARFMVKCLRLIDESHRDLEPVTITRHGRPVAEFTPIGPSGERPSIIGVLRGSVASYDDRFSPAIDPTDWASNH